MDKQDERLNIRPYMDALRREDSGGWSHKWDTRGGGCRMVSINKLTGNRWLTIQFWEDGNHRVSHGICGDGFVMRKLGPSSCRETTYPTYFGTPAEMIAALAIERTRIDHKPLPTQDKEPSA